MNDNEAKILITADSSGVEPGVAGANPPPGAGDPVSGMDR